MAEEPTRKLAVLLHADVVGSTALGNGGDLFEETNQCNTT